MYADNTVTLTYSTPAMLVTIKAFEISRISLAYSVFENIPQAYFLICTCHCEPRWSCLSTEAQGIHTILVKTKNC